MLTLNPSKAQEYPSSPPIWKPGGQSDLAQPTRIGPAVRISNSKYLNVEKIIMILIVLLVQCIIILVKF